MNLRSPRRRRPATAKLALIITAIALAATGCSAGSASSESSTPKVGGTAVITQIGDPQPGFPLALRGGNAPWIQNVFQPLTRLNDEREPEPVLAKDWKFADDRKSMTINLKDNVTFHSGRKMTAEDVVWTFQKTTDPASGSPVGFIAKQFTAMDVLSPTSLKITFASAMNPATVYDFFEQSYIVDKDTYSGLADGSKVIGTGPYKWGAFRPGVSVELTRYDGYWDKGNGQYLDSIGVEIVGDSTAQLSAVRSSRAQVAYGLTPTDTQGFANDPQFGLLSGGGVIYALGLDVTAKPFDDVRVRQAVAYAIDRNRINQQIFAKTGTVTNVFWGDKAKGITDDQKNRYAYNLDKAKSLIEEAGATGAAVPITVVTYPVIRSEYEIIANNLTAIGLKPQAVIVDETTFNSLQNQNKLGPAFFVAHGQVGLSETTLLSSLPSLRSKNNPSHFDTPEYTKLQQALLSADAAGSPAALKDLTNYMLDQAFSLPIVQAPNQLIVSKKLHGASITTRGWLRLDQAYLAE